MANCWFCYKDAGTTEYHERCSKKFFGTNEAPVLSLDKKAKVFYGNLLAGYISETDEGYEFAYNKDYLLLANSRVISLTIPLQEDIYRSKTLFPFFDGLIPEGWLLDIAIANWKINARDRFGLLLCLCKDCIGCVSVQPIEA